MKLLAMHLGILKLKTRINLMSKKIKKVSVLKKSILLKNLGTKGMANKWLNI